MNAGERISRTASKPTRMPIVLVFAAAAAYYILPNALLATSVLMMWYRTETSEIARATSPDKIVDAVLVSTKPGFAIESYGYEVFIVPAGSSHLETPVLEGYGLGTSKMVWIA